MSTNVWVSAPTAILVTGALVEVDAADLDAVLAACCEEQAAAARTAKAPLRTTGRHFR